MLRWANDPQVRTNSFSSEPIDADDHHRWFQKGLADLNRLMLIATASDGCPVGQIRFDRHASPDPGGVPEATVGLSLDRCARGHGLAKTLVRLGLQEMEQRWGPSIDVVAEVMASNTASNGCFSRCGFTLEGNSSRSSLGALAANRWRWHSHAHSGLS